MPIGTPALGRTRISGRSARARQPPHAMAEAARSQNRGETSPKGKVPKPVRNQCVSWGSWVPSPWLFGTWPRRCQGLRSSRRGSAVLTLAVGNVVAGHPARMRAFFVTCTSKPLSGTGQCKTSRAKAIRGLSCTETVKRRHSALGAKKKVLQRTAERQVQVQATQQGREEPMSGST